MTQSSEATRSALGQALAFLRCPSCHAPLELTGSVVRCSNRHAFDVARQGYVNLVGGGGTKAGDTAAMVAAREEYLAAGHYEPLAAAVAGAAEAVAPTGSPGCVVDVGAGTGSYLARVLDLLPDRIGIGLDASRHALRRAARVHARAAAVGCDVWAGLPVRDGAAAVVLDVFAPRNADEMARILHPDGGLVVVTPTLRHLAEVAADLGLLTVDQRKPERLTRTLGARLVRTGLREHEHDLVLDRPALLALAGMGPAAHHHSAEALRERVDALAAPARVTVSVDIATYRAPPRAQGNTKLPCQTP